MFTLLYESASANLFICNPIYNVVHCRQTNRRRVWWYTSSIGCVYYNTRRLFSIRDAWCYYGAPTLHLTLLQIRIYFGVIVQLRYITKEIIVKYNINHSPTRQSTVRLLLGVLTRLFRSDDAALQSLVRTPSNSLPVSCLVGEWLLSCTPWQSQVVRITLIHGACASTSTMYQMML